MAIASHGARKRPAMERISSAKTNHPAAEAQTSTVENGAPAKRARLARSRPRLNSGTNG